MNTALRAMCSLPLYYELRSCPIAECKHNPSGGPAQVILGPSRWATVFGEAETRLSGGESLKKPATDRICLRLRGRRVSHPIGRFSERCSEPPA